MANFTLTSDLRTDALWTAGEPTATTGAYYAKALAYINAVLTTLTSGGALGAISMPKVDWWWARGGASSPGSITILDTYNDSAATTVTLTLDSTTVSFSAMAGSLTLANYRLLASGDADQLPYISAHTAGATSGTLALAWKRPTLASANVIGWKDRYDLPTDFVKLSTSIRMGRAPYEIPIVDIRDLDKEYPRHRLWLGTPQACAIRAFTSSTGYTIPSLHFSHTPSDGPLVVEFEYIAKQTELTAGATEEPPLPHQHRRILSLGSAYLMLIDKNDNRQTQVGSLFRDAWDAMAMDEAQLGAQNDQYGRLLAFPGKGGSNQPLRTSSGLIIG